MYRSAHDHSVSSAVARLASPFAPNDYDAALPHDIRVHFSRGAARARGRMVLLVDGDYPAPDANRRRKIAAAQRECSFDEFRLAVVSSSQLLHAAMTSVAWLTHEPNRIRIKLFEDFAAAVHWASGEHGDPRVLFELRHLVFESAGPSPRLDGVDRTQRSDTFPLDERPSSSAYPTASFLRES